MSFEEDEFRKQYEFIDCGTNTDGVQINGVETSFLRAGFRELGPKLIRMEAMAREIEFDRNSVGFEIKSSDRGKVIVVPKGKTAEYFAFLKGFLMNGARSERRVYSPHVQAVVEAFDAVGLPPLFCFRDPSAREHGIDKTHGEIFNQVVAKVSEIVRSTAFKERLRVRARNATRNEARGLAIEHKVFKNKSRRLVLMLHFGYKEEHRAKVTFDEIQRHRTTFFNNCRSNKLLRGIVDYIWKLEEGDQTGLHMHVLIFYTADSCRDVRIAQLIGEYWRDVVTGGKGQYWNSNADKLFHAKYGHGIGTGEINWKDDTKREALRANIRYMTKADQFLKIKHGEHSRLFGTSQVEERKKLGRPRIAKSTLGG